MSKAGAKIITALQDAVAGKFARVTIEGQAWVPETPLYRAAPDLLEALRAMVDRWEPDCGGQDRIMWENACAAIAKAADAP